MKRTRSISAKLALIVLVIALPLTAVLAATYDRWFRAEMNQLALERVYIARSLAASFSALIIGLQDSMGAIGDESVHHLDSPRTIAGALAHLKADYPITYVVFTDPQGRLIASTDGRRSGDFAGFPAFRAVIGGKKPSGIEPSRVNDGVVGFHVTHVARDEDGSVAGVVGAFVSVEELPRFLGQRMRGGAHIADSAGRLVYDSQDLELALERTYWAGSPIVRAALRGREATTRQGVFPPDGGEQIAAAVPIGRLGWEAGASVGREMATAEIRRSIYEAVGATVLVAIVATTVAYLIGRRITLSLSELVSGAKRIGAGDFEAPLQVHTGDEVEELSRSLDETRVDLERYVSGLVAISESAAVLSRSLALRDVRDAIVAAARRLFGAQAAWVVLYDEESGLLERFMWHSEIAEEPPPMRFRPGEGVAGTAFTERRLIIVPDIEADPRVRYREWIRRHGVSAMAALPLMLGDRSLGVLGIYAPHMERWDLGGREQYVLSIFASHAATTLENARLFEEERTIADTLQKAILATPERLSGVEFSHLYRSATEAALVGGDFYDMFEIEHERVGVLLGDVAGKGLDAAALTSVVKNIVRAYSYDEESPAGIVTKTNRVVHDLVGLEDFVTLFFGVLENAADRLTYCSAGHPPGILRRRDGRAELVGNESPIVGPFRASRFTESEARIEPGDVLVLYTDGAIEARRDGEMFGEERLLRLVERLDVAAIETLPQAVYDEIAAFAGGRLADDIALLALRRR